MKRYLVLAAVALFVSGGSASAAGVVSGTIKGPEAAPLRAVFVRAENTETKMTTIVLSNNQGHYRVDNLAPGTYQISATAVGYRSDPARLTGVDVGDGKTVTADFAMRSVPVQWSELTRAQAAALLPEAAGKERFLTTCGNCHGMSRITGRRDHDGWLDAIDVMRQRGVTTINPAVAEEVATYLAKVLGPDSATPQSPTQLPAWEQVKPQPWSDEALNIVYVDYPVGQGPGDRPGTGYADKDGNVWMELDNGLARLDPATGKVTAWHMPGDRGGGVHEVLPLPDGSVWLTVTASKATARNRLARFDTRTQEFEIFQDPNIVPPVKQVDGITPVWGNPRVSGEMAAMRRHTAVQDHDGNIWSSGRPLTKFDVKTRKFTVIPEAPDTYGIALDPDGNVWFAEFNPADYNSLGKVDPKTNKVTKYKPPLVDGVDGRPRRVKVDSQGNVWIGQYFSGSVAKFDRKTERFTTYKLPGLHPTVYGFGIDHNDNIWGVSHWNEATFRLDPKTGKVVMYPSPYTDRSTRDLWVDAQGRMWYGAQVYYKIGYFYLRNEAENATR